MDKPFVTIAMPALNEERYIGPAIRSLSRIPERIDYEILVLDGGSTDRTREIVEEFARADPRIRLVPNERRIQSAAVNLAANVADPRSRYLIRADCHADYPEGFVERCLDSLERNDATSVVVPMRTVGATCFQKAIATAQNSRLGNGGSAHRMAGGSQFVDHGHHAAFRRDAFLAAGGYDETFTHNEDAELDVRLRRAGGRIWLEADAAISYFPRATLPALARQYFAHGKGRAKTIRKHGLRPKLRQLLPLAAVGLALLSLLGAVFEPHLLVVPVAYISAALLAGALLAVRETSPCSVASGLAALAMHSAWAFGFATAFVQARKKSPPRGAASRPREAPIGAIPRR